MFSRTSVCLMQCRSELHAKATEVNSIANTPLVERGMFEGRKKVIQMGLLLLEEGVCVCVCAVDRLTTQHQNLSANYRFLERFWIIRFTWFSTREREREKIRLSGHSNCTCSTGETGTRLALVTIISSTSLSASFLLSLSLSLSLSLVSESLIAR
jgi:hypothetical protein